MLLKKLINKYLFIIIFILLLNNKSESISFPLVQSGSITITAGNYSSTITLPAPVNPSAAFPVIHCSNNRNNFEDCGIFLVSGRLSSDGSKLILERQGTGQSANVSYHVIQSTEALYVQHGSITFFSTDTIKDIIISNVPLNKSFVILSRRSSATRQNHLRTQIRGWLLSSTDLRLQRDTAGDTVYVEYSIITFRDETTVQTGEVTFTNSTTANATLSSSVTISRSWLYFTVSMVGSSGLGWSNVRGEITDTDTLTFYRGVADANNVPTVRYFVIEFPDNLNANVQAGSVSTATTGDTILGATVSPVNISQNFIYHTNDSYTGTGTAYPRPYWINMFTSNTNIQFRRWYQGQSGTINWQVVRLPDYLTDKIPPSSIDNFSALQGDEIDEVKLSWISTGDDLTVGELKEGSMYKIQFSTWTEIIWSTAIAQVSISTSSVNPGNIQSYSITGLKGGVTYYFRIWTGDEVSNWSYVSFGATFYLEEIIGISIDLPEYNFGSFTVCSTQAISQQCLVINNIGNVDLNYLLKLSLPDIWKSDIENPGDDIFVLQAQFNSIIPDTGTFSGSLHGLTTSFQMSDPIGSYFAGLDEQGYEVSPKSLRHLWFFFLKHHLLHLRLMNRLLQ